MIYTVTLNPSIDYVVQVEPFMLGTVNRAEKDMKFPEEKELMYHAYSIVLVFKILLLVLQEDLQENSLKVY